MAGGRIIASGGAGAGLMALALSVATPNIISFEGQKSVAYRDIVGVLTVCAGHTGPDIVPNHVYTADECKRLTEKDVKTAADGVLKISPQLVWHPMQLAAAVFFTYNVGTDTYKKSTVAKLFNSGDYVGACNFLVRYNKAKGKVVSGLVRRRAEEQRICLSTLTPEGIKDVQ